MLPERAFPPAKFQKERRTVGTQLAKGSALISRVGASVYLRWATTGGRPYGAQYEDENKIHVLSTITDVP
jgi:hypothetical protein